MGSKRWVNAPPKVSRILGRKICGNFFGKKLPHILRPKILLTLGGIYSHFTPGKKAPPLDPKSYTHGKILILRRPWDSAVKHFCSFFFMHERISRKHFCCTATITQVHLAVKHLCSFFSCLSISRKTFCWTLTWHVSSKLKTEFENS